MDHPLFTSAYVYCKMIKCRNTLCPEYKNKLLPLFPILIKILHRFIFSAKIVNTIFTHLTILRNFHFIFLVLHLNLNQINTKHKNIKFHNRSAKNC